MNTIRTMSLAIAALCALAGQAFAAAPAAPATPAAPPGLVTTTHGPVQGIPAGPAQGWKWLGIPYAAPPVGERRWQAPQPPAAWANTLQASAYGNACAQIGTMIGPPPRGKPWGLTNVETFDKPVGSEDCLTLNIWRPEGDASDLPVLVFAHGGASLFGHSGDPIYDAARLANSARIIIVTINYRLGLLGAFRHPALKQPDVLSASGNFATLDVLQSLRFVRDNIRQFGGDPRNVTLMGQSAGGNIVYRVMGSPQSADLFHKAIILSAVIPGSWTSKEGWAFSEAFTRQLLVDDGLANDRETAASLITAKGPAWTSAYLKGKSADALLAAIYRHHRELPFNPGNYGDGTVMPADLEAAYESGQFRRVPTLIGMTRDEAKLLTPAAFKVSERQRFEMMMRDTRKGAPPVRRDELLKGYLLPAYSAMPYNTLTAAMNWYLLRMANGALEKVARHQPATWAYRFDWDRSPEPWHTVYGAGHSIDLPFVFGNFQNNLFSMYFTPQNQPGREALSALMMRSLSAFMRSGNPNAKGLPEPWQPWNAESGYKQVFNATDQAICGPGACD